MNHKENITISFEPDEKGYFDRECPNEECQFLFKINMDDWKNKVSDDIVYCPFCGHTAPSDQWWTQQQLDEMNKRASAYVMSLIGSEIDNMFNSLAHTTIGNKYIKITYKPGKRITFENNPIGQSAEWKQDILCPKCETRYSVVGSAFFCPCCGRDNTEDMFENSLNCTLKKIESLPELEQLFIKTYGDDMARNMCLSMIESTLGDVVAAFQAFAKLRYQQLSKEHVHANDFQIIEKGSSLFKSAIGKGYDTWLSDSDLRFLNLMFQRRHVFEHQAGLVDEKYLQKSGDTSYYKGQRVVIRGEDIGRIVDLLLKLASGLRSIYIQ